MKTELSQIKSLSEAVKAVLSEAAWMSDKDGRKKLPKAIADDVPMGAKVYIDYMGELPDLYAYNDFKGGVHFWNVEKGEWTYAKDINDAHVKHMDAIDNRTSFKYSY